MEQALSYINRDSSAELKKRKIIYILSPSFSGSTLLTLLLAQHSDIATIGELKATAMGDIGAYICSCGVPITDCSFWSSLQMKMLDRNLSFEVDKFGTHFGSESSFRKKILGAQVRGTLFESIRSLCIRLYPPLRREFASIVNQNKILIDHICELQDAPVFMDGSKDPNRLLYLLNSDKWDVEVVKITRNGRAQCNSRRQKERNPVDYLGAIKEWRGTVRQIDSLGRRIKKEKLHELKYEDLCSEPAEVLNSLFESIGLSRLERDWVNVELKQSEHHILGNSMRTKERIQIKLDERWKDEISNDEETSFSDLALAENNALGYQ